tara:strand:- start:255 stop:1250 length:996 start_codon:yes stop_codon:yes gene_type:complete
MCREYNDNTKQTDNNCRHCGSIEEEDGDTHIHCAECGIPKDTRADDNGFVPTNPNQTSGPSRRLGTSVGSRQDREIRHDRRLRRLSTVNVRVAHKKPSFLDGVIGELSRTPAPPYLHAAASDIVKIADSEKTLSSMRHSLRGLSGSRDENRQYRQRLFAVASLEILEDAGYEAPIAILIKELNIDRYDLKKVKSRLKRLVSGKIPSLSNTASDPTTARRSAMLDHLLTFRDHLAEQEESITSASEVFETSKKIASSWGEPIEIDDDWVWSDFTNRPETAVAGKAFMEAMHRNGFSRESILELHDRYPVLTLDTFILKKGWEDRTKDVAEEA